MSGKGHAFTKIFLDFIDQIGSVFILERSQTVSAFLGLMIFKPGVKSLIVALDSQVVGNP